MTLVDEDVKSLLAELAVDVARDARRIVPVRTGRLQRSIGVRSVNSETAVVEASAPYAGYVELGTRYMKAQPYLKPALYRYRSGR
jgi:HK97 gp10 family phage protein